MAMKLPDVVVPRCHHLCYKLCRPIVVALLWGCASRRSLSSGLKIRVPFSKYCVSARGLQLGLLIDQWGSSKALG